MADDSALSCKNLNDFLSCQKKLGNAWSSNFVGRTLTATLLEDICTNFDMLERKAKMRALVSLIALDSKKKQEFATLIKKLLGIAVETSEASQADKWVAITAGVVFERLFGSDEDQGEDSICRIAKLSVKDTTSEILKKLLKSIEESSVDGMDEEKEKEKEYRKGISPYFLPLKNSYIPLPENVQIADTSSRHFVYQGEPVDIMGRERKRQKVDDDHNKHASLINVNSPSDTSARRKAAHERAEEQKKMAAETAPTKRLSLMASVQGQGQRTQAAAAQSISLESMRGLIPHNLTEAEKKEIQRTKKKALRKAREEEEQKRRADRAAAKAEQEERAEENKRKKAELEKASREAMNAQRQAIQEEDKRADNKNPEEVAAELLSLAMANGGDAYTPAQFPLEAATALSQEFADVIAQVEASTVLGSEDKEHITNFFLDTQFGAGLPSKRFLLKETPLLGDSGQKIGKELTYLELDYASRSYKFVVKKAYKKAK